jgi:uncharacterized protein (DUF2225 family)
MRKATVLFFGILTSITYAFSTTWDKAEIKCPICENKNQFLQVVSFGSYIYNWPEKFEYIYWPYTDSFCLYSCSKCKYSAFMWDFTKVGGDTLELIKKNLKELSLNVSGYEDKMVTKLESAEKIYKLYMSDPDFWCRFYRTKGYHYSKAAMPVKAQENRFKALKIAEDMLKLDENTYKQKELLLITASMKFFTFQDSAAIKDINLGLTKKFNDPGDNENKNKAWDEYLTTVLTEFKSKIQNKDKALNASRKQ